MRTRIAVVGVVLLCTWLVSVPWAQEAPKGTPLSGTELQSLFASGALFDWTSANGVRGTLLVLQTGVAHMLYFQPAIAQGETDRGQWRIDGDAVCYQWFSTARGKDVCVHYFRLADGSYESRPTQRAALLTGVIRQRQ